MFLEPPDLPKYARCEAFHGQQSTVGKHVVESWGALTMVRRILNADGLARSLSKAVGMKNSV